MQGGDSSLVHNVTSRSYPIALPGLLFTRRYLTVTGFTANLSSGYESQLVLPTTALLCTSPPLSSSSSLFLPLDIGGRSALGFGYHVSRPLLYTYRSSALLACAIFLTALNTALTEISERFPARQHFPVSDRECSK